MKLLIVDDEPKIRNGLYQHFKNTVLDFEVIEMADNGSTALEKARNIQPDIILADICMPGMNGLDFIEKISSELTRTRTIVISGHDNFSYAQKALRCGVQDYVLKPIDLSQFDQLMKKVYDELLFQEERRKHISFALESMNKNKVMLVNNLFMRMIQNEVSPEEVEHESALIGITIPDPAGLMVVKVVNKLTQTPNEWEMDLLRYALENITDELCIQFDERLFFTDRKNNMALLFAYKEEVDYVTLQNEIRLTIENCVGYEVKIDMTEITDTRAHLSSAYKQVLQQLSHANEFSRVVVEAKNYIAQNYYREDLTLQTVADAIQVNPSYISKLMRRQLGMSFVDYLTQYRMKQAVIMLVNCEKDVKLYEIAYKLGYSNQHYFCRVFTKCYGISPMQYRMKAGAENE